MQTPSVLVVDDQPFVLQLLGLALSLQGLATRLAASGSEAIELYKRHREDIGVVLLDVQMPGLDGPQTLAALRRLDPDVRCCFMSNEPGRYTPNDLLALGAGAFLAKPFSIDEAARTLRQVARQGVPRSTLTAHHSEPGPTFA
jgi:CheY-like chemotaxis protein